MVADTETQTREDDGTRQEIKLDKRVPAKLAGDHTAASLKEIELRTRRSRAESRSLH